MGDRSSRSRRKNHLSAEPSLPLAREPSLALRMTPLAVARDNPCPDASVAGHLGSAAVTSISMNLPSLE
jgi:hypothetical protein